MEEIIRIRAVVVSAGADLLSLTHTGSNVRRYMRFQNTYRCLPYELYEVTCFWDWPARSVTTIFEEEPPPSPARRNNPF